MPAETHTVVYGDTLWKIAEAYFGDGMKYKDLVAWNNIPNPDVVTVGQVIKLRKDAGGSTSSPSNKVKINVFGPQANVEHTLVAAWLWDYPDTDHYEAVWEYYNSADNIWYTGNKGDTEEKYSTFSIPENAHKVRFKVKPIAKKVSQNGNEVFKWTHTQFTDYEVWIDATTLITPSAPNVTIDGFKLTATLDNIDITGGANMMRFQVVNNHILRGNFIDNYYYNKPGAKTYDAPISTGHSSIICTVAAGGEYKVRCYAFSKTNKALSSEWSEYSSTVKSPPNPVKGITSLKATSSTSIRLEWEAVEGATSYDIEYTKEVRYFDGSNAVESISGIETTSYEKTGMESGEYFFRIRALNSTGKSVWSEVYSIKIGDPPSAPTTWSSSTTAITGEDLLLYWVHNAKDGTTQTLSDLYLKVTDSRSTTELTINLGMPENQEQELQVREVVIRLDGVDHTIPLTIFIPREENKETRTCYCDIPTDLFPEGVSIEWKARTAGVTNEFGDWSVTRKVDIYAMPTLEMSIKKNIFYSVTAVEEAGELQYFKTNKILPAIDGDIVAGARTSENDYVYTAVDSNGDTIYYCVRIVSDEIGSDGLYHVLSFPFQIYALAGPATQTPISYHVSISPNEAYESTDSLGNFKMVSANETIYSKYFDIKRSLLAEISAGDIDLENNVTYTATCTVALSSGLTAEDSVEFTVNWEEVSYIPTAEIGIDSSNFSAMIRPYCTERRLGKMLVNKVGDSYVATDTELDYTYGQPRSCTEVHKVGDVYIKGVDTVDPTTVSIVPGAFTDTGEQVWTGRYLGEIIFCTKFEATTTTGEEVYFGIDGDGNNVYYCMQVVETPITDALLSVYRREFDGTYTELATGLNSTLGTTITDPHPALDFARYRIVATSLTTGSVGYSDIPGIPVDGKSVILQWDEQWDEYETSETAELANPEWNGSMLILPYNIEVSDNNNPEIELVNYIGRKNPVSYYGTQIGQTSSWSVVIDKKDKETLYGLRRLAIWMGDVYVREPSGSGYWASVKVSFSQRYDNLTIPVQLSVTRVEGGV